jgi:hypothetical protein
MKGVKTDFGYGMALGVMRRGINVLGYLEHRNKYLHFLS